MKVMCIGAGTLEWVLKMIDCRVRCADTFCFRPFLLSDFTKKPKFNWTVFTDFFRFPTSA